MRLNPNPPSPKKQCGEPSPALAPTHLSALWEAQVGKVNAIREATAAPELQCRWSLGVKECFVDGTFGLSCLGHPQSALAGYYSPIKVSLVCLSSRRNFKLRGWGSGCCEPSKLRGRGGWVLSLRVGAADCTLCACGSYWEAATCLHPGSYLSIRGVLRVSIGLGYLGWAPQTE